MDKPKRPSIVTDAHLEYLDALRESGVTNMFGAGAYLREDFDYEELTLEQSTTILSYWMKTFGEESR